MPLNIEAPLKFVTSQAVIGGISPEGISRRNNA